DHPAPGHKVHVVVRDDDAFVEHDLSQESFRTNPRHAFNLNLTEELSATLETLGDKPTLGEFFEIHEGIHSGNIREELFVDSKVDESCRELIFGRDEIRPYVLQWKGKFVRLSAVPEKRSRQRYANVGRKEWYEQDKILVRRTGDYVLAAVDRTRRYASNNFFLLIPKSETTPPLDAVAAVLNSKFMTWFFRTIEPRKGRMFAEVKIKHLRTFPLPCPAGRRAEYKELSELGKHRAKLAQESLKNKSPESIIPLRRQMDYLDGEIEKVVLKALNVVEAYREAAGSAKWKGDEDGTKQEKMSYR
ncbi:MAG: TaqI-like C-terminal specificity domain-containing protein, partial [Terriglobales bacterium]